MTAGEPRTMTHPIAALIAGDKPPPEYVIQAVSYNHETGELTWNHRADMPKLWNTKYAGKPAFAAKDGRGYRRGAMTVGGRRFHFLAHQIAWVVLRGKWADQLIDHIDGDKGNNRASNLREVTNSQNMQNGGMRRQNQAGLKGVSWNKNAKRWQSAIKKDGRSIHLGYYQTKEEAHGAYCEFAKTLFGEYARFQ